MRRDKDMLLVNGRPIIEHIIDQLKPCFDEILICANRPDKYSFLDARVVVDQRPGLGPLMGIASALKAAHHSKVFITACDIPAIDPCFLGRMLEASCGFDSVVPHKGELAEPLFALYRKSILPIVMQLLERGERRVKSLLQMITVKRLELEGTGWLRNLNTIDDYEAYRREIEGEKRPQARKDGSSRSRPHI